MLDKPERTLSGSEDIGEDPGELSDSIILDAKPAHSRMDKLGADAKVPSPTRSYLFM